MKHKLGTLCIVLGSLLLLASAGLQLYNTRESKHAGDASQAALTILQEAAGEPHMAQEPYAEHIDSFDEEAREAAAQMQEKTIGGYAYVGYLSVPILELELPVMSACDYERLQLAPCREYGSTKTDDLVICAHNYASHFGNLSKLETGDLLTFTDMEGEQILYSVEILDILEPTAVDTVKNSDFDLVLYTCTYGGKQRVTVFCNRVF